MVCTGIAVKTGAAALTTSLSAMAAMAKRPSGGHLDPQAAHGGAELAVGSVLVDECPDHSALYNKVPI